MAALLAGLPPTVPGVTVNRLCASGAEAMIQGARALATGEASIVIAGGVESMSRAPYVLPRPEEALPRSMQLHQTVVGWRLVNPRFEKRWTDSLGECSERVATRMGITREEMDEWSVRSHVRAHAAWEAGLHSDYVLPVGDVQRDESIRADSTPETLAALKPAFTRDGTVTAGNSSPINDGASAALMTTAEMARRLGAAPLGRIVASATVALEPDEFALAPVPAIRKLVTRTGVQLKDVAVFELQEAFAAVVCSCLRELPEIDPERVNPNGGAIALGHPLGASAPRIVIDLCRELRRRGGGLGIAAACIGVGLGQAILVEVDG
jgi:acetyl-CoA acetyltransferase family protein